MIKRLVCALALCAALASPGMADDKVRIAVMDLQARGVPETLASTVSALVRSEIVNTGLFTVVEREQINEIMKEQGLQMSGCTEQACAVQMGRLLSARKMLVGELNAAGGSFVATIRIVDVELGVSEFAADETAVSADDIPRASKAIAGKLTDKIQEKLAGDRMRAGWTPAGYYLRVIVPGWAQIYTGHTWKGTGFAVLEAGAIGFSVFAIMDFQKKKKAYDDLTWSDTDFDSKYNAYKSASTRVYIGLGAAALVYAVNWIDALFFSKPEFGKSPDVALFERGTSYFTFNCGYVPIGPLCERRFEGGIGTRL